MLFVSSDLIQHIQLFKLRFLIKQFVVKENGDRQGIGGEIDVMSREILVLKWLCFGLARKEERNDGNGDEK